MINDSVDTFVERVERDASTPKHALLGISETRWTQTGQRRISTGELLLFFGYEEDHALHTEGVTLML